MVLNLCRQGHVPQLQPFWLLPFREDYESGKLSNKVAEGNDSFTSEVFLGNDDFKLFLFYGHQVAFVSELPKTVSGKIQRNKLRSQEWGEMRGNLQKAPQASEASKRSWWDHWLVLFGASSLQPDRHQGFQFRMDISGIIGGPWKRAEECH